MKTRVYLSKSNACDPVLASEVEDHLKYMLNYVDMDLVTFHDVWDIRAERELKSCDILIMVPPKQISTSRFNLGKGQYSMLQLFDGDTYIVRDSDGVSTALQFIIDYGQYNTYQPDYKTNYGWVDTEGIGDDEYDYELDDVISQRFNAAEWKVILEARDKYEKGLDSTLYFYKATAFNSSNIIPLLAASLL